MHKNVIAAIAPRPLPVFLGEGKERGIEGRGNGWRNLWGGFLAPRWVDAPVSRPQTACLHPALSSAVTSVFSGCTEWHITSEDTCCL